MDFVWSHPTLQTRKYSNASSSCENHAHLGTFEVSLQASNTDSDRKVDLNKKIPRYKQKDVLLFFFFFFEVFAAGGDNYMSIKAIT